MELNKKVVVLLLSCFSKGFASMDNFTIPSLPAGCACPGDTLNFTCTIADNLVVAIWSGSAFACQVSANPITILRAQFETSFTTQCGPLAVSDVSIDNSTGVMCYSSVLSANISTVMNRQTVKCSRDDIATGVIGSPHTLSVAGAAPVSLRFTTIGKFTFTFSWIPTVNCSSVTSYQVNADASNCGNCRYNPGTNTATCSGWRPNGQTCSLSVMSEVCGGMTGDPSESLELLLQEPVPQNVSVKLRYPQSIGILSSLSASYSIVFPVQVTGLSLPVTYSVQLNSNTRVFPESNCSMSVCTGTFTDFPAEDFDFAVVVSNGLGNGQASPSMRVLSNIYSVVSLTMEVIENITIFTLNLLEGFVGTTDMRVEYRTGGGVVMNATNSSTASAGGSLSLTLTALQVGAVYTFSMFITQNGMMTEILGTFSLRCQPEKLGSLSNSTMCSTKNFIGGVRIVNGDVCYTGTTPGGGFFTETFCDQGYKLEPAASQRRFCQSDGDWNGTTTQCVPIQPSCSTGCIIGIVCGGIGGALLVIVVLLGGFIVVYKYKCKGSSCKSKSRDSEKHGLTKSSSPPPPGPDSLYADPNTIEHLNTATGQVYAMDLIEYETAPFGVTYAEVDKPKRGSSKKREPDVVPPGSGGLNYIEVDVTGSRQKPESDAQRQSQDLGRVECSVVTPEENSDL